MLGGLMLRKPPMLITPSEVARGDAAELAVALPAQVGRALEVDLAEPDAGRARRARSASSARSRRRGRRDRCPWGTSRRTSARSRRRRTRCRRRANGRRITCMPRRSHAARSSVESTSSNQPTLRCVRPHTLVWSVGTPASAVERDSTAICRVVLERVDRTEVDVPPRSCRRQLGPASASSSPSRLVGGPREMPFDIVDASCAGARPNTSARARVHALVVGRGLRGELGEVTGEPQVAGGRDFARPRRQLGGAAGERRRAPRRARRRGAGLRCDGSPSYQPPYWRQMLRTTNSGSS